MSKFKKLLSRASGLPAKTVECYLNYMLNTKLYTNYRKNKSGNPPICDYNLIQ